MAKKRYNAAEVIHKLSEGQVALLFASDNQLFKLLRLFVTVSHRAFVNQDGLPSISNT